MTKRRPTAGMRAGLAAAVLAADNSGVQFQWNSYRSGCVGPVIFGVCIGVPIYRVADKKYGIS